VHPNFEVTSAQDRQPLGRDLDRQFFAEDLNELLRVDGAAGTMVDPRRLSRG
jgi:hypothetical protein